MSPVQQPGPHIPTDSVASKVEKPREEQKTLRREYLQANPGPVIPTEEQVKQMGVPKTREELRKEAEVMNKEKKA
jgi:hypothetical protein